MSQGDANYDVITRELTQLGKQSIVPDIRCLPTMLRKRRGVLGKRHSQWKQHALRNRQGATGN